MVSIDLLIATVGRIVELERLLSSLRNQTYQQFSVIIADQNAEGFLDATLKAFSDLPVRRILVRSAGVSQARNHLLPLVKGDIVAFPDDDCWYAPQALDRMVSLFTHNPHAYGFVVGWAPQGGVATVSPRLRSVTRINAFFRGETYTQFYRKEALLGVAFDPQLGPGTGLAYGCGEDTDFLLQVLSKRGKILRTSEVLVYHSLPVMADPALAAKAHAYALGRMRVLHKHRFSLWFMLANVLYPLFRLPFEGKKAFAYRKAMFLGRLKGLANEIWAHRK